jgi:hypothetical protein
MVSLLTCYRLVLMCYRLVLMCYRLVLMCYRSPLTTHVLAPLTTRVHFLKKAKYFKLHHCCNRCWRPLTILVIL